MLVNVCLKDSVSIRNHFGTKCDYHLFDKEIFLCFTDESREYFENKSRRYSISAHFLMNNSISLCSKMKNMQIKERI